MAIYLNYKLYESLADELCDAVNHLGRPVFHDHFMGNIVVTVSADGEVSSEYHRNGWYKPDKTAICEIELDEGEYSYESPEEWGADENTAEEADPELYDAYMGYCRRCEDTGEKQEMFWDWFYEDPENLNGDLDQSGLCEYITDLIVEEFSGSVYGFMSGRDVYELADYDGDVLPPSTPEMMAMVEDEHGNLTVYTYNGEILNYNSNR